ncbi:MAG: hypothetical protein QF632_04140 [Candidatus Woesearchaeota archaeon]|jgi:hypothetical protein|nr:hypothetical protein [Candidatus Woesearchaeota archaeon]
MQFIINIKKQHLVYLSVFIILVMAIAVYAPIQQGHPPGQILFSDVNLYFENGNVGIGATTPGVNLHIKDLTENAWITVEGTGNSGLASISTLGQEQWNVYTSDTGKFRIDRMTAGGELTIDTLGRVGIGSVTPQAQLDVDGDTKISGNLQVTGSITSDTSKLTYCTFNWPAHAVGWRIRNWVATDCSNGLPLPGSNSVGYCRNGAGTQCEADCTSLTRGRHYNHPTTGGLTSGHIYCLYIHH